MSHDLPKTYDPGAIEAHWAEHWVREKVFSIKTPTPEPGPESATAPVFNLLLPPPNVTGSLHMGHMFEHTEMDIIIRWRRMRGFLTLWLPGTDHAGIATQLMVERQLVAEGSSRQKLGREGFVGRVWDWKKHYGGSILSQMKRLGDSVDWDREYFTLDDHLSRCVTEVFVRLHEEGLIYRGKYIVNWCPRCMTAISDLEVTHEDAAAKIYQIRYPLAEDAAKFITVATTRPETMLGDTAVAVNPSDLRYAGLVGKKVILPLLQREIPIIADDYADPQFGSGAVKITPAHDANDFQVGLRHNLPQINVMDDEGRINENGGPYQGLDRLAAREKIIHDLEQQGLFAGAKDHTYAIGKCSRCRSIVEPRLSMQWFVAVKKQPVRGGMTMAEAASRAVSEGHIRITPENYKTIYLQWMDNIYDWCISRQLWWGHRIPAWHCGDCTKTTVARETPQKCAHCGSSRLEQETDVLDTWFSSALLPFTTLGWPLATQDLKVFYPTTLLITGFDILFFWMARMIMMGCHFMSAPHRPGLPEGAPSAAGECLRESVPFREVYIHALVRDAERQKMSKTKGNVVDPIAITEKFGTDAVRFTLASMASPGTDIAFNEDRTEGYRAFANKIWNAARFMFMNLDRIGGSLTAAAPPTALRQLENRWIYSRFHRVAGEVNASLSDYRFDEAANTVYKFFWGEFCDWYLEIIKPALSGPEAEARAALAVLGDVFEGALRLLSPIMPFITEEIWHAMYEGNPPLKSIALARFPELDQKWLDDQAEEQMALLQKMISDIRDMRADRKVDPKLKTPVKIHTDSKLETLIRENLVIVQRLANVTEVEFVPFFSFDTPGAGWGAGSWLGPGARTRPEYAVDLVYNKKIDVAVEQKRLSQEMNLMVGEAERLRSQLNTKAFLIKAPKAVVATAKKRLEELDALISNVRSTLLDFMGKTDAKVHHYLPQFYLEGFLDPDQQAKGQNLLWVYEPGKEPRLSATAKAAQELHFYSFEEAGEIKATAEAVLSQLESRTAPIYRRLISKKFAMTQQERSEFAGFIAMMFARTPRSLESIDKLAADFEQRIAQSAANAPGVLEDALDTLELRDWEKSDVHADRLREFLLSDRYTVVQQSKAWTLKMMFQTMLSLIPVIESMRWTWMVSDSEYFWTSDHPIALADETAPYYSPGFMSSPGAEFTFPLSKEVCLFGRWHGKPGESRITPFHVRHINKLTAAWAKRYVYVPEKSAKIQGVISHLKHADLPEGTSQ